MGSPTLDDPDLHRARLPAACEQQAHEHTGGEQLRLGRDADAVPSAAAMEELLPTRPEPRDEVLEIGQRRRGAAEHRGVGRAAASSQQGEREEAAADLEAPVRDVLVRHAVAGHVQGRAEQQRERPRADERSDRASGRHVQRDDHLPDDRVCSRPMGFLDSLKKAIQGPVRVGGDDPGEVAATLHEEATAPHESDADLETVKELSEGPRAPGAIAGWGRVGGQGKLAEDEAAKDETGMGPEEDDDKAFPNT